MALPHLHVIILHGSQDFQLALGVFYEIWGTWALAPLAHMTVIKPFMGKNAKGGCAPQKFKLQMMPSDAWYTDFDKNFPRF
jgi:hypothetical protein